MNIAPTFGLDPVSLDRAAAANAKRMVAAGEALRWRDKVRELRHFAKRYPDTYDSRTWFDFKGSRNDCDELYTGDELLAIARENWVEALWGMNRRVCG